MELDELRSISAKEELSLNFIAKDEMLSKALFSLQNNDDIILKGGTAINRIFLKNKRFSEDIDFDLISNKSTKDAIPRTKQIVAKLNGFNIAKPRIMKKTIRYDLYYINPLNHKDKIRLEFNTIKKAQSFEKKIVNFGFVPSETALLNVYNIEIIIFQKITCLLNRLEGKDFFDTYYLLELEHKKLTELKENKEKIIKRIALEEKQVKSIANATNHYLPRNQRPNWQNFLQELKEKIKKY